MNYAIVSSKLNGNTGLLTDVVKNTLNKKNCLYCGLPSDEALKADLIYIGFWTIMGTCDKSIDNFISKLTNQKVFLFGSCGFGLSDDYFNEIIKSIKDKLPKEVELIGSFMCQGKMPQSVKDRYLDIKAKDPNNKKIDMMIQNFDMALSHPNEEDIKRLESSLLIK